MKKQWIRLEKSTREATCPQPSFRNTSSGRITGYGKLDLKKINYFQNVAYLLIVYLFKHTHFLPIL